MESVAFLFTDIEGSTRLWERDPAAMRTALARHDEALEAAVRSVGGLGSARFREAGESGRAMPAEEVLEEARGGPGDGLGGRTAPPA